jgi:hypothetical protein
LLDNTLLMYGSSMGDSNLPAFGDSETVFALNGAASA